MAGVVIAMIAIVVLFFLLILFIVLSIQGNRRKRRSLKEQNIIVQSSMHHIEGLPISEKTICVLSLTPDKLTIEGGGTDFNIGISQIRAAEVKTDVEIANIVQSSAVKGIAGGLLFGPIGLVVGARPKNKQQKTSTYYLIINYTNSAGEVAAVMFDGGNTAFSAQKIALKLKPILINNPKQTVQL